MSDDTLTFKEVKKEDEIVDVSKFDIQAFTDFQGQPWTLESIKREMRDGWKLLSVACGDEIVAAVFLKKDADTLYTKNTPIKLAFQGNGFSHRIKDFYEKEAGRLGIQRVVNYCPVDNFRMIALNESHGYRKTGKTSGGVVVEWEKIVR